MITKKCRECGETKKLKTDFRAGKTTCRQAKTVASLANAIMRTF